MLVLLVIVFLWSFSTEICANIGQGILFWKNCRNPAGSAEVHVIWGGIVKCFWLLTSSVAFLPKISKSVHICQTYCKTKSSNCRGAKCRWGGLKLASFDKWLATASVVNFVRSQVYHTERPPLFAARLSWYIQRVAQVRQRPLILVVHLHASGVTPRDADCNTSHLSPGRGSYRNTLFYCVCVCVSVCVCVCVCV